MKTVAEYFNYYKGFTVEALEKRAAEIGAIIDTDAGADIEALNIELRGIKEARENAEQRSAGTAGGFNVITGMGTAAKKSFDVDTVADQPEYRSAFLKSMLGQPLNEVEKEAYSVGMKLAEKRADAFNSSSDSMAVLPTTTLNEIIKKARTVGGLLAECRAFNVPTKIAIPVATPGTKATWHTEGAEVESEKANLASVTFDGYEIIKVFSISAKVRKMSLAAFENYLVEELSACVLECIADALINGTGNGQGTGLLNGVTWDASNSVEIPADKWEDWKQFVAAMALLKRGYAAGAKWAMNNKTFYSSIYVLEDTNGRPIYIENAKNDGAGKAFAYDVVIDDNIPDNVIFFGNYSKYLGYNMPDGVAIEASTQSSFKKGLVDYRALCVADCKPIVGEAFVKITKGA